MDKVRLSYDGSSWSDVDGGATFTANSAGNNDKKENRFTSPTCGRYVRIVVQTWNTASNYISMRAGVLVCQGAMCNAFLSIAI